jgi:hypothetical protein
MKNATRRVTRPESQRTLYAFEVGTDKELGGVPDVHLHVDHNKGVQSKAYYLDGRMLKALDHNLAELESKGTKIYNVYLAPRK